MAHAFRLIAMSWGVKRELPIQLAERFLIIVNSLRRLGPAFRNWNWLETIRAYGEEENGILVPLDENPKQLARAIEHNVNCENDRTYTPDPDSGYFLLAATGEDTISNYLQVSATAANTQSWHRPPFANDADIIFAANGARPSIVCFDTVKSLLLIMAETWEASSGVAFSSGDFDMDLAGKGFKWGWMTYLSPYFANRIEPPTGVILDYRPNGGLFMAATTEVFDRANPVHYDAAQTIRRALDPLNDLPFPLDQPYR